VGDLVVDVVGCRSDRGTVVVSLLGMPDKGASDTSVERLCSRSLPASTDLVSARFVDVPAGSYAVVVLHDENDSGDLDLLAGGLPREGVGFTHDPGADAGAPAFEEVRFAHGRGESLLRVTMQYLT